MSEKISLDSSEKWYAMYCLMVKRINTGIRPTMSLVR